MVATVLLGIFVEQNRVSLNNPLSHYFDLKTNFFTVFFLRYGAVRPQISHRCGSVPIKSSYIDHIWALIQVQKHLRDVNWRFKGLGEHWVLQAMERKFLVLKKKILFDTFSKMSQFVLHHSWGVWAEEIILFIHLFNICIWPNNIKHFRKSGKGYENVQLHALLYVL